jgi:hypothetical protein
VMSGWAKLGQARTSFDMLVHVRTCNVRLGQVMAR